MHDDATECGCGHEETLVFDEQGNLTDELPATLRPWTIGRRPPGLEAILRPRPCPIGALNGSWLLELEPVRRFPGTFLSSYVRGPMRIEVGAALLRVSGDVYTRRNLVATTAARLAAPSMPWYPQLPPSEYAWYFRSAGCTYSNGTLQLSLVRHLWNRTTQDFVSTDTGTMQLTCQRPLLTLPGTATVMTGTATLGGQPYTVRATQTSSLQRGCRVEVDVMRNRSWPASADLCSGAAVTFTSIYATAGWDIRLTVDRLDVPEDAQLTNAELQTLMATHRAPASAPNDWRLWLFVGSNMGGLFGVMFDDDTVPREGAVGFADPTFGSSSTIEASARGQALGDVPLAFLRTLVHEAGHAFNLFHPKHDVHAPAIGTTIMNQTGDVMGFATVSNPYPCTATMAFDDHSRTSLLHSPDPQVRPGWKNFGWGHGSLSAGVPEPVDADGLTNVDETVDLHLAVAFPDAVYVGEYVYAEVTVTNGGDEPREVTARLNLAEGDLRFLRRRPDGRLDQVRDVVVACGPRPTVVLEPGQSLSSRVQVFFTNLGYTFEGPGIHDVMAELDTGNGLAVVRSEPVRLQVRMPVTEEERDIAQATLDRGVGRALALGDFGSDVAARDKLAACAETHADADTGAACALVLVNALSRRHVEYRADGADSVRAPEMSEARKFLDLAVQGRSAEKVLALATTVASPVERDAPIVDLALTRVRRARKPKADVARAEAVAADFVDPAPS